MDQRITTTVLQDDIFCHIFKATIRGTNTANGQSCREFDSRNTGDAILASQNGNQHCFVIGVSEYIQYYP